MDRCGTSVSRFWIYCLEYIVRVFRLSRDSIVMRCDDFFYIEIILVLGYRFYII